MIRIDGVTYDVPVVSIQRNAELLDRMAERTEDGVLTRQVIGTYYNYTIEWGSIARTDDYNALYAVMTAPVPFHQIVVPGTSGDYEFTAYISSVKDEIKKIHNGKTYWHKLSANFIAKEPARRA